MSSHPLNIANNTWWLFSICLCCFVIVFWLFASNSIGFIPPVGIIQTIALAGGQPARAPTNGGGKEIRLKLKPDSDLDQGLPAGFGIAHSRQSGLSRCGLVEPPKLVSSNDDEDGPALSLIYPPGRTEAVYGIFVVAGSCASTVSNCSAEIYDYIVALDLDGGDGQPSFRVRLGFGRAAENRSGFKATGYHALHTPWPAYFAPSGTYLVLGISFSLAVILKLAGKLK